MTEGPFSPQQATPAQPIIINNSTAPSGKRVNHTLHLILTILTAGLWLPVWLIIAIASR